MNSPYALCWVLDREAGGPKDEQNRALVLKELTDQQEKVKRIEKREHRHTLKSDEDTIPPEKN